MQIGIKNVEYLCGKVEDCLGRVFTDKVSPTDTVIAILDPARAGLGSSVMQSLRAASRLNHLVYVSCDAENATQNFVEYVSFFPFETIF